MKTISKSGFWRSARVALAAFLISAPMVWANVPAVVQRAGGTPVKGMLRWQPASKVYVLTTDAGVSIQIPVNEMARMQVARPTDLDGAIRLAKAGKHTEAIPVLERIYAQYVMLQHDVEAARWLAESYLKIRNATKAVEMCQNVIASKPEAAYEGELVNIYWDALVEIKDFSTLRAALTQAAQRGNRRLAALAQVKRGDIDKSNGKLQDALLDGYLRTVVFFGDVKEVMPEALYKAAKCFEELGQHPHVDKMRKRLLAEFPKDPYTKRIQSGA